MKKYNTLLLMLFMNSFSHSVIIYNASNSPLIIKASDSCSSIHHAQSQAIQPKSSSNITNIQSKTLCLLARIQNNESIFQMKTILNIPNNLVSIQESGSEIHIQQMTN